MTKIAAIDVLTEDDLAICWRQTGGGGPMPLTTRRASSSLHGKNSPGPGPQSPMTEFRAQP